MDATVIHNIGFHHLIAASLENLGKRESEQVVAHMPEMQGLVGVGRGIFHHHERRILIGMLYAEIGSVHDVLKHRVPECRLDHQIKEPFYHVETVDSGLVLHKPVAYFSTHGFRTFACGLHPGEHNNRKVAFKLFLGCLRHNRSRINSDAVKLAYCAGHALRHDVVNRHNDIWFYIFCFNQ